jgi:hypothetical protein
MKKSLHFTRQAVFGVLVIVTLLASSASWVRASQAQLSDPPSDQVAVKLRPGVSINTILARYDANLLGVVTETNLYFLQLLNNQTANQLLPTLNADPDLFYAEPNYYSDGSPGGTVIMFGAHVAPNAEVIMFGAHGSLTPTPPSTADQWAWIKIGLADAQRESVGQGIIVAVLDTGLAPDHPLLKSSITAGYDFVGMTNNIYDTGPGQDVGHGTHVSGIIVTEAPGVQIMPIRVLNSDGLGTYWEVSAGIRYAVDHGAKVINMSMSAPRLTPSLSDAISYATSHGVIIVAAAGTGPGPNYPAAYPDPLAVLGVGATDQNDAIAWFSGGQSADTDIFAPGVNIYSAFPYNGYALGSGTSMSTPMVAAEVAMLLSRYPNWSPTQVIQRILGKTAPVSGYSAGRINLSAALNTGLELRYQVGDNNSPNDNNIKPRIRLVNNSPEDIPLNQLKIRYWYTIDSDQPQTFNCDWASIACTAINGTFTRLPDSSLNKTATSDTYLEVSFADSAGTLAGGGQADMYLRINKNDWSNYAEANDYSFDPTKLTMLSWDHITLYRNGSLIWGAEPTGATQATNSPTATWTSTRTPTNTSTSSATQTRTSTRLATNTYTPTRTATATITKQYTNTFTPTRTVPPPVTSTPTRTQTLQTDMACAVSYSVANDWGSGFAASVTITNAGTTTVNGWALSWSFPGNQAITSMWNGSYTQSGSMATVTNAGYNGTIGPGSTASFGFNAGYSGTNAPPSVFSMNGVNCK